MKLAGTFIGAVAALALAPAAQAASIAFERTVPAPHSSSAQIFKARPGGLGEVLLASPRGDLPTAPSFSADGRRLVFERQSRIGYGSISIARADGRGERAVPGEGHHPSLSPDGRRLALDSGGYVRTEALDGSHRTRVVRGADPEFSPDGRGIAFVWDGDVYVSRSGQVRRLTTDGDNAGPTWAPSGKALAFWHMGANDTVERVNADGTGRRSLHAGMQPAWSPDGKKIAFASNGGVWTMSSAASGAKLVVRNAFLPAWQP
jgi:Tol biopolymer transport system component